MTVQNSPAKLHPQQAPDLQKKISLTRVRFGKLGKFFKFVSPTLIKDSLSKLTNSSVSPTTLVE